MLAILKALFAGNDAPHALLSDASDRFLSMLQQAGELLSAAEPYLLSSEAPEELAAKARKVDKASNKSEREIRKMLVEALAFDHSNGSLCLILMSVAKDGERLVDECRNLLDLAALIKAPVPESYATDLHARAKELIVTLQQTHDAFGSNDQQQAIDLVEGEKPFIAELHTIQDRILDDAELSSRQAILVSRAFRIIQRIRAHLANIASTVILPVHQIDFAKRSYVEEAKRRVAKEQ